MMKNPLMEQIPVLFIGASVGVWLFYVQHQFANTYWARREQTTLTLLTSLNSLFLSLWDEDRGRLVGFGSLKRAVN